MRLTSFKWMAAGFMLSAICAGTLAVSHGMAPANTVAAINWTEGPMKAASPEQDASALIHAKSLSAAFRNASQKVLPAVVTIQSVGSAEFGGNSGQQIPPELLENPFFRRFFENIPDGQLQAPGGRQKVGTGSGVIVDSSGIILTNNHVVNGADKLLVKLHDGREFEAIEWKTDKKSDIAVVKIQSPESLPAATIGNSDNMEIGDWVIAVGAPFGLDESVTAGIISAKSRGLGIADREDFLQTDAAINPGNSGGPLVNLDGEVVGINTAISTTSGGYQGIGFAVPVNLARWVGDQLMTHGAVQRAFLGVGVQSVNNALSRQLGLNAVKGAVVTDVRPGSPAAKAGLQSGDVVVEFDGAAINKPADLQARVERASLADTHRLTIIRGGKTLTLEASVEAMPTTLAVSVNRSKTNTAPSEFMESGLQLSNLTSDVAGELGVEEVTGVAITGVKPGSAAHRAGLQVGMIIKRVGQTVVNSISDFELAMKNESLSDGVLMLVKSGESSRFVVVKS